MHTLLYSTLHTLLYSTYRLDIPKLSLSFQLSVTQQVLGLVSKGHPTPDHIMTTAPGPSPSSSATPPPPPVAAGVGAGRGGGAGEEEECVEKLTIETSVGDVRLWLEILRNLTKDLNKHQSIQLSETTLTGLLPSHLSRPSPAQPGEAAATPDTPPHEQQRYAPLVAFSCGHAYPLDGFQNQVMLEFVERVQDFPLPLPHTLKLLQSHYKQSQCCPSACPHCVFHFLRKLQMEECPKVPIRPWNL